MKVNEITDQVVIELQYFIKRYGIMPKVCLMPRQIYKQLLSNLVLEEYKLYTFEKDSEETICGLTIIKTEDGKIKVGIV